MNKQSRKRKYDVFNNNFNLYTTSNKSSKITDNQLHLENKRLKIENKKLKKIIIELEQKIEKLSIKDLSNDIPCELEMFYYM